MMMPCITFFPFLKLKMTTNDTVKQTIEAVTEIWLKSGIPMKSRWLQSKQLMKIFESWKTKNRDNNTIRNNRKRFFVSLETLFDLASKNAEQQISGDRLRTEKGRCDFFA